MSKLKSASLAGVLAAGLFTLAVSAPVPAEARIVCREGWHWNSYHCVQIPGWRASYHPNYRTHYYRPYNHGRWNRDHDRSWHRSRYEDQPRVIHVY